MKHSEFKENVLYSVTFPEGFSEFLFFDGVQDSDGCYNCDICGKNHNSKVYCFVSTVDDENPLEDEKGSNVTSRYFFGTTCIKKLSVSII